MPGPSDPAGSQSSRIQGENNYEAIGASEQEIAKAGGWTENRKGNRPYSRAELNRTADLSGQAGRAKTQLLHNQASLVAYPQSATHTARQAPASHGQPPGSALATSLIGSPVYRSFTGKGRFRGKVESARAIHRAGDEEGSTLWMIRFDDGDSEEWDLEDLRLHAPRLATTLDANKRRRLS